MRRPPPRADQSPGAVRVHECRRVGVRGILRGCVVCALLTCVTAAANGASDTSDTSPGSHARFLAITGWSAGISSRTWRRRQTPLPRFRSHSSRRRSRPNGSSSGNKCAWPRPHSWRTCRCTSYTYAHTHTRTHARSTHSQPCLPPHPRLARLRVCQAKFGLAVGTAATVAVGVFVVPVIL